MHNWTQIQNPAILPECCPVSLGDTQSVVIRIGRYSLICQASARHLAGNERLGYHARMMIHTPNEAENLRAEIAALAARMIAEDGADYASAKKKAARQLLGNQKIKGDVLPDNAQIEQEVREYNELFFGDTQPQRLLHLRQLAIELMEELERFNPYLVGSVLNGTAGNHSDIYLHLYADNAKDVAIYLLNKDIQFEVSESFNNRNESIETLSFMHKNDGVHLILHEQDAIRSGHGKSTERANLAAVKALLQATPDTSGD